MNEELEIIPQHVAIILDGNRTWAKRLGKTPFEGHKAGFSKLKETVENAKELGIKYLTVYAFSTENWNRSKEEVTYLMDILRNLFKGSEINKLKEQNVRITVFGDKTDGKIPEDILKDIKNIEEETKNNDEFFFNICFNYGGRREIVQAIKKIPVEKIPTLTEDEFSNYIYSAGMPDPDLIIRPSGHIRMSNFLLWQLAYSEFLFIDECWPDFDKESLINACKEFANRNRKFGRK